MKKIFLVLLGFLMLFGIISCNNGSDLNLDMDEFIASPINLSVDGHILNWDEVENAKSYTVFINDQEEATVTKNSFDFSKITGDKLLFRVRTNAPRKMQDSPLSVSIAYVANYNQEVNTVINYLPAAIDLFGSNDIANELVRKGMTSQDVSKIVDSYNELILSFDNVKSYQDIYNKINAFLSEIDNDNLEAIVSVLVNDILGQLIENQIEMNNLYDNQAATDLQMLLDEINNNPEALILSLTKTIEYFLSIEEMMSTDLISYIQNVVATDNLSDINPNEAFLIKDEMVNILRETMPTQEDMVTMYQVYDLLSVLTGAASNLEVNVENYEGKMAAQTLLTLEAFINYLDTLDETFFTDIISNYSNSNSKELADAENVTLLLQYYNSFLDNNKKLIDNIKTVFTDDEREIIYNKVVDELRNEEEFDTITNSKFSFNQLQNINFETLLYLQITFEDSFNAFLDAFVERNGEFLIQIVIESGYNYNYFDGSYKNDIINEEYNRYVEYNHYQLLTEYKIADETVFILNQGAKILNNSDYQKLIELVFAVLPNDMTINQKDFSLTLSSSILSTLENSANNVSEDQLNLTKNILKYLVDKEVFSELQTEENVKFNYIETTYPTDALYYEKNEDPYLDFVEIIEVANIYDNFMNRSNKKLINSILAEYVLVLHENDIKKSINLTDSEIDNIGNNLPILIDYITEQMADFAKYDASNLTSQQISSLNNFVDNFILNLYNLVQESYAVKK